MSKHGWQDYLLTYLDVFDRQDTLLFSVESWGNKEQDQAQYLNASYLLKDEYAIKEFVAVKPITAEEAGKFILARAEKQKEVNEHAKVIDVEVKKEKKLCTSTVPCSLEKSSQENTEPTSLASQPVTQAELSSCSEVLDWTADQANSSGQSISISNCNA